MCAAPDFDAQARAATARVGPAHHDRRRPACRAAVIRYGLLGAVDRLGGRPRGGARQPAAARAVRAAPPAPQPTVSTDRMADVLWPAGTPANAVAVLRTYVARLARRAVDDRGAGHPAGRLRAPRARSGEVDADCLEVLLAVGRAELERGDAAAAETALREALPTGARAGLPELPDDHHGRRRAGAARRAARGGREELVEARLAQGDHRELVPALRAAVAEEPLRERGLGTADGRALPVRPPGRGARCLPRGVRGAGRAGGGARNAAARSGADDPAAGLGARSAAQSRRAACRATPPAWSAARPSSTRSKTTYAPGAWCRWSARPAPARLGWRPRWPYGSGPWLGARVWWVDLGAVGPGRVIAATSRDARGVAGARPYRRGGDRRAAGRRARAARPRQLRTRDRGGGDAGGSPARGAGPTSGSWPPAERPLRLGEERVHRLVGLGAGGGRPLFAERAESPLDRRGRGRRDRRPARRATARDRARGRQAALGLRHRARPGTAGAAVTAGRRTARCARAATHARDGHRVELRPARRRPSSARCDELAVFPGTFDAAAAEAVVGEEVLPRSARLVDASLVAADPPRYRLLMTVRTFACERLREVGEEEEARRRHRDAYPHPRRIGRSAT